RASGRRWRSTRAHGDRTGLRRCPDPGLCLGGAPLRLCQPGTGQCVHEDRQHPVAGSARPRHHAGSRRHVAGGGRERRRHDDAALPARQGRSGRIRHAGSPPPGGQFPEPFAHPHGQGAGVPDAGRPDPHRQRRPELPILPVNALPTLRRTHAPAHLRSTQSPRARILALVLPPLAALAVLALPADALAQAVPAITAQPGPGGSQTYSLSMQTLLLLSMLTFLPAMMLMMTGFTRIIIVLGLLRSALGTGTSPPNQVLVGLAIFLTFFTMSPVFDKVYTDAYRPLADGAISFEQALERGSGPFREFM